MNNQGDNTSLFDLIFNIALGLCLMFMVSVMVMKKENQKQNLKTKAEFTIILTWQDGVDHDLDLWIRDPHKNVTSFKAQENGITHLDRDDLGMRNDYYVEGEKTVYILVNQEIATIRGFMAGEWVVNTHFYRAGGEPEMPKCNVQIVKLNPVASIILNRAFSFERAWEEKTIARLMMEANGNIVDIDEDISIPLMQTYVQSNSYNRDM